MQERNNTVAPRKPLNLNQSVNSPKDVFEYSVFGSPNQKIGNFTGQKKLGDFNA